MIEKEFVQAGKAVKLRIRVQDFGIPPAGNHNDFVFVYADAVDEKGNIAVDYEEPVRLTAVNGHLIGHRVIGSEIGTAAFMVQCHEGEEKVYLTAESGGLSGEKTNECRK